MVSLLSICPLNCHQTCACQSYSEKELNVLQWFAIISKIKSKVCLPFPPTVTSSSLLKLAMPFLTSLSWLMLFPPVIWENPLPPLRACSNALSRDGPRHTFSLPPLTPHSPLALSPSSRQISAYYAPVIYSSPFPHRAVSCLRTGTGSYLSRMPNRAPGTQECRNYICWNEIKITDISLIKCQLHFHFSLHGPGRLWKQLQSWAYMFYQFVKNPYWSLPCAKLQWQQRGYIRVYGKRMNTYTEGS